MGNGVLSLAAATALLISMGAADAKQPVTLTEGQLDMVTAGIGNTGTALQANAINFGISLPSFGATSPVIASVSLMSSFNNSVGTFQTNLTTGSNSVQQNSIAIASGGF